MSNSEEMDAGGRTAVEKEKAKLKPNKFSVTCSLLSRYLNDRKRDFGPGLSFHATENNNQPKTPRTMDLLPAPSPPAVHFKPDPPPLAQKKPQPDAPQLTIFYAGKVLVFDDFPAWKAKELVVMAAKGGGGGGRGSTAASRHDPVPIPDRPTCPPPQTTMPPPSTSTSGSGSKCSQTQPANLLSASDLPIARRVSLNRFLEKRKGRISSKAPYPSPDVASTSTNTSTSSAFPGCSKPELPEKAQQIVDPTAFGKHDRTLTVDPVSVAAAAAAEAAEEKQQAWLRLATPSSSGQSEFDLKR